MNSNRLDQLLQRLYHRSASDAEREELLSYLTDELYEPDIKRFIAETFSYAEADEMPEEAAAATLDAIFSVPDADDAPKSIPLPRRIPWIRRAAVAAIFLLIAGTGVLYMVIHKRNKQESPVIATTRDLPPGTHKAMLTLADGTVVSLDSNGRRSLQQGSSIVEQKDDKLIYQQQQEQAAVSMNTLTTPRGAQFHVQLSDGTKVWLDAASSITYPAAFTGSGRKVRITGQAYFEIAKDATQPFLVDVDGRSTIEVLGTDFNVNSYADDGSVRTTLVQGSVRVRQKDGKEHSVMLRPGEQAVGGDNVLSVRKGADLDEVLAWKNGLFKFQNSDIQSVMKQLERWYDIEVRYEGTRPKFTFSGEMDRGVMLSTVRQFLLDYGVRTRLEGKILIIE